MNNKGIIWIVVAIVVVIGGWSLLLKGNKSAQETKPVKVGFIGILSGEYATVGQNIANGVILAKEEWNASHPNLQFDVISEDDGFDASKGVSAYQKLVNVNKVEALIDTSSPTIDAIYDLVTKKGFPVIQFGNQGIDPTDDNVIQVTAGNRPLEVALGKIAKEKYPNNIAVYRGGDAVFTKFFNDFKEGYNGEITEYVVNQTSEDSRGTATKILAKGHEAVVIIAAPTDGAKLLNELFKSSKSPVQFFFDANMQSGIKDYTSIVGDMSKLNGALVMAIVTNKSLTFAENYKKRFGEEPGFWADYGYDGFMALANGYDKTNTDKEWIENIKKSNFAGASGKITFDDVGVLNPSFELQKLQDGSFVSVGN